MRVSEASLLQSGRVGAEPGASDHKSRSRWWAFSLDP